MRRGTLILILLLAVAGTACGKKGPPRPPLPPYPADVQTPQARQAGETLEVLVGVPGRRVNGEQRRLDKPFGELGQEMGVLNSVEIEELLQLQQQSRLQVSDAMLRLGRIPIDRLHLFGSDQLHIFRPYREGECSRDLKEKESISLRV